MNGKILKYNVNTKSGIILGDNNIQYNFDIKEWKSPIEPLIDYDVDFLMDDEKVINIYLKNNISQNNCKIIFMNNQDNLNMYQLSQFLKYFNLAYLRLKDDKLIQNIDSLKLFSNDNKTLKYYKDKLEKTDNNLVILELDKHSPLEILINIDPLTVVYIFSILKVKVNVAVNISINVDISKIVSKFNDFFEENKS